jgi:formylglycine-generating enzyme required for sulfatase activity
VGGNDGDAGPDATVADGAGEAATGNADVIDPDAACEAAPCSDASPADASPADASPADASPADSGGDGGYDVADQGPVVDGSDEDGTDGCDGTLCGDGPVDGDADAAEVDASPRCTEGAKQCDPTGAVVQVCADGGWTDASACAASSAFCKAGDCINPASCTNGYVHSCGAAGDDNCCSSRTVPGGSFSRSYDGVTYTDPSYQATIGTFSLDIYEVTVARFRNFVAIYDRWKPTQGAGSVVSGDGSGWDPSWTGNMPATAADLQTELSCPYGTWTNSAGSNETLPVACVDWYTAFAFCIWDGGRLPTEAEWNYAAAGGNEQRAFPWGLPNDAPEITSQYAIYATSAPSPVGSTFRGAGKWGHFDLAGNVDEWIRDYAQAPYPSTSCDDCVNLNVQPGNVIRGGDFASPIDDLLTSVRYGEVPTAAGVAPTLGVRCARSL